MLKELERTDIYPQLRNKKKSIATINKMSRPNALLTFNSVMTFFPNSAKKLLMMSLRKLSLPLLVAPMMLVYSTVAQDSANCFAFEQAHNCYLNTMTPYRFVANTNDSVLEYSDCSPRKLWLLLRHGTRFPGRKWTARMREELPKIKDSIVNSHVQGLGTLNEETVELFRKWRATFSSTDVMKLAAEGERELASIAERFQSRFPSLMPEVYSNETYTFKFTATQRTEESAKHFVLGLFGRKQSRDVWFPDPEYRDRILRSYKCCERWRKEIDKNPESMIEKEKFVKSPMVEKMLNEVSKRVGFALDYETVNLVHKMCAYETAWNDRKNSPWCRILSIDDFKVLEFAYDLQYYWIDGYAYPLTYELACTATRDMFDFLESSDETTTQAYFTHSGTILKLLALLGIAKDENTLRHDSFSPEGKRAWRTSLIDAFASNIAFVSYDCKKQGPSILVMHQERVVQLPDCPADAPCPLSTMKKKYPDNESECPFEDMCAMQE